MMNSTITKWLENLETKDAAAKEQLKEGLNRLVQQGDESGVWNVIACASSNWVHNVNQIENLTHQLNEYKVSLCLSLYISACLFDVFVSFLSVYLKRSVRENKSNKKTDRIKTASRKKNVFSVEASSNLRSPEFPPSYQMWE